MKNASSKPTTEACGTYVKTAAVKLIPLLLARRKDEKHESRDCGRNAPDRSGHH